MSDQDHSRRILVFGIALAIVGLICASAYARAATFNERFTATAETPKSDDPFPEQWGVKLLLFIEGKVARAAPYDDETYPSSDACKNAVIADTGLQERAQKAAKLAVESYGPTAGIGIACAMQLD
jgi:hypothetical protein